MPKESYDGPLEPAGTCCYRIPKSYKQGMRVDGLIFANETLLAQLRKDQAPDQVANVAFLPGIQVASMAMPDIHWGYGFPIGGVAATDPEEGGVITPGGIGFDINCLTGDARVLHAHGYTRRIDEMAEDWRGSSLTCYRLERGRQDATGVERWFSQRPRTEVLRVATEDGDEVRATADHPFYTPTGMVPLGQLQVGDTVALAPFEGVPYEAPSDEVIVTRADIERKLAELSNGDHGNATTQVLNYLEKRGLLPLRYSSPALPVLCKLLGYLLGDGALHFLTKSRKGRVYFYGQRRDLELIRADVRALGIKPSRVYARQRQHAVHNGYAEYRFQHNEEWCRVGVTGLAVLLACLGAPVGKKAASSYDAPGWLERAPLWHKRLFLAALFGADLTAPSTITGHGTLFNPPVLSMNKRTACIASGERFLRTISRWLAEFGVETQNLVTDAVSPKSVSEETTRLRLILSGKAESLIALWSRVGYEYNRKRRGLAALAVQYLKRSGSTPEPIPTFADYCATASADRRRDGMVWGRIAAIERVPDYDGLVYDFTVRHDDHNFVASGFVVSNCGVRLVRTNLMYREVNRHIRPLIDALFKNVPTGVGRSGKYRFDDKELNRLMAEGARYLLGRDLATAGDITFAEAEGRIDGADPGKVSDQARKRGREQCGTLGSGNHFMEVQVVDAIFDEEVATAFGLEKDQVCVMIHSGSRGLGYQVCDDAIVALRKAPEKYGIDLPDKQLVCAPVDSPEGQDYLDAMRAAANFAFCNRQLLMWQAREVFADIFGRTWEDLGMTLLYDVCHNIAKLEEHTINGKKKKVWVHRKGATRAFPAGHPEIPAIYSKIGQPVIIPGDMGRASWILVGAEGSMLKTFGTTCHGAGRAMSRTAALRDAGGRKIDKELEARGVIARAQTRKGLAEEQPRAYKNVDEVVEVVHDAELSRRVARMRPIGVIKG